MFALYLIIFSYFVVVPTKSNYLGSDILRQGKIFGLDLKFHQQHPLRTLASSYSSCSYPQRAEIKAAIAPSAAFDPNSPQPPPPSSPVVPPVARVLGLP